MQCAEPYCFETSFNPESYSPYMVVAGDVIAALRIADTPAQDLWSNLLQGVVEYKIAEAASPGHVDRIVRAAAIAGQALRSGAGKGVRDFLEELASCERLTGMHIAARHTSAFSAACRPDVSRRAAERLAGRRDTSVRQRHEDLLIIALGHSGTVPALQAAIYYDDLMAASSMVYPVRYSYQRRGDVDPQLTADEVSQIGDMAIGRDVVVFDEAIASAATMGRAMIFFQSMFRHKLVFPGHSLDYRQEYTAGSRTPQAVPTILNEQCVN